MWWRRSWFSLKGKVDIRGQTRGAVLPHPALSTNHPADPCNTAPRRASLRHHAAALLHSGEGLVARNCGEVLVIVPGTLALVQRLDLEQIHVVHHAAVLQHLAFAGEEVVNR